MGLLDPENPFFWPRLFAIRFLLETRLYVSLVARHSLRDRFGAPERQCYLAGWVTAICSRWCTMDQRFNLENFRIDQRDISSHFRRRPGERSTATQGTRVERGRRLYGNGYASARRGCKPFLAHQQATTLIGRSCTERRTYRALISMAV